jgi:hypothetical protein
MGQTRKSSPVAGISALLPRTDILCHWAQLRFGPNPEVIASLAAPPQTASVQLSENANADVENATGLSASPSGKRSRSAAAPLARPAPWQAA